MKITIKHEDPKPPKIELVTLELTLSEAYELQDLIGASNECGWLYNSLDRNGVKSSYFRNNK